MSRRVPAHARLEIKFVASELEVHHLTQWLRLHPAGFYTPHPDRQVNNVYFDTHHYFAFTENLSGASARTKVRYRWYGHHDYPVAGALEIKCKRNYFGWKLRFDAAESPCSSDTDSWPDIRSNLIAQLEPEARKWLEANPHPVILNRYHRSYFVTHDGRVRATIDTGQVMYDQRYKPAPNITRPANIPRTLVLEFKFARSDRDHAAQITQGLPLRVSRNSKYMTGVKAIHGF